MKNSIDNTNPTQSPQAGNVSENKPPEQTSSQSVSQEPVEQEVNPLTRLAEEVATGSQPFEEVKDKIEIDIIKNSGDVNSLYERNQRLQRLFDLTRENIKSLEKD